jgi:hypothetical protein
MSIYAAWFSRVQQALEDAPIKTPYGKNYISTSQFKATEPDEVSFEKGVVVQVRRPNLMHSFLLIRLKVLEQNLDGWWKVRYLGAEGWAPAANLAEMKSMLSLLLLLVSLSSARDVGLASAALKHEEEAAAASKVKTGTTEKPPPPRQHEDDR